MKYTINGKKWTEFDINMRCAELLAIKYTTNDVYVLIPDPVMSMEASCSQYMEYNPCNSPLDTDTIIDKCLDELLEMFDSKQSCNPRFYVFGKNCTRWEYLMQQHNCTKLVAACICYIEINEAEL
jgi:hypothetical protein